MRDKTYSLIIPLYNEEEVALECVKRATTVMEKIDGDYEIIFVNDGSVDKTVPIMEKVLAANNKLKMINFSRNFGHQIAITAGMDHAIGDAVIVMDADLQDPPELIPQMIEKYLAGYEVVYAVRAKRKGESIFKRISAKVFYRFLRYMCNIDIPVDTGDFRLISKEVCKVMTSLTERNRYVRGLVSWVGFKQIGIEYEREERFAGVTKYPFKKMLKLSIDGITSFSTKPLTLSKNLGFFIALIGFIYAIIVVIQKFALNMPNTGWASITVVLLILGGVQLITLGIVGDYIARIFDESKNRPLYIVSKKYNMDEHND